MKDGVPVMSTHSRRAFDPQKARVGTSMVPMEINKITIREPLTQPGPSLCVHLRTTPNTSGGDFKLNPWQNLPQWHHHCAPCCFCLFSLNYITKGVAPAWWGVIKFWSRSASPSGNIWNYSLRLLFSLIKINGNIPLMISLHPNPGPDSFLNKGIDSCVVCVEILALIVLIRFFDILDNWSFYY